MFIQVVYNRFDTKSKFMKYIFSGASFILALFVHISLAFGQLGKPEIWLKPDSIVGNSLFYTNHGTRHIAVNFTGSRPNSLDSLNHNTIYVLNSNVNPVSLDMGSLRGKNLQVILAYKPDTINSTCGLFEIKNDTTLVVGLTNKKVLQRHSQNTYSDTLFLGGAINTTSMFLAQPMMPNINRIMSLGKCAEHFFSGGIGDVLIFNKRTSAETKQHFETYLALKYGITLLDGDYMHLKDTLWSRTDFTNYYHAIAGLGKDSLTGLNQCIATSSSGDVVTLGLENYDYSSNLAGLEEATYLIWGHNGADLNVNSIVQINNDSIHLNLIREWLIRPYAIEDSSRTFWLRFDATTFPGLSNPLLKIHRKIDEAPLYKVSDSIDLLGRYYFKNLIWDTDHSGFDKFSFVFPTSQITSTSNSLVSNPFLLESERASDLSHDEYLRQADYLTKTGKQSIINHESLHVYPVPSQSTVNAEVIVNDEDLVEVYLFNQLGAKISHLSLKGNKRYLLAPITLTPGLYIMVLHTKAGTITKQIIIIN